MEEVSIRTVQVMMNSGVRNYGGSGFVEADGRKDGHSPMQRDACACASTSVAPNRLRDDLHLHEHG
jgi:hypothetical protein